MNFLAIDRFLDRLKTYLADIIPKVQQFSKKLDDITLLTKHNWVLINDTEQIKNVYIFKPTKELLISRNGKIEKAKGDYLGNNSLHIEIQNESRLFRQGFLDDSILALKVDGIEQYAFFLNEAKAASNIKTISDAVTFLRQKYLEKKASRESTSIEIEVFKDAVIRSVWLIVLFIIVFFIAYSIFTNYSIF